MEKEEAQKLLKKYYLGQCTERELKIIDQWYQSLPEENLDLSGADNLIKVGKRLQGNINSQINRIEDNKGKEIQGKSGRIPIIPNLKNLVKIAAIILIGIGFSFYLIQINFTGDFDASDSSAEKKLPSTIYLSDGSVVWLKGESRLDYPENFTGATREVTLIGEAFFDIADDQRRPFIIHTANFKTSVLGTSFNIKAYENEASHEVAVITGKVLVSVKEDTDKVREVVLIQNQKANFIHKEKIRVELDTIELPEIASLKKSKLVFNESTLGDIISVLNREHDSNITLANTNLESCIITTDLTNETLEISVEILAKSIQAAYTIEGRNIILSGEGCKSKK